MQTEDDQDGEQSLDALVTEPQGRGSLTIDLGRTDYPIEGVLANRAIVGNLLDVEKTSVGGVRYSGHSSRHFPLGVLGRTGIEVGRLGLSASYGAPASAVQQPFDHGVNYFYWGSFRRKQFGDSLRRLAPRRDRFLLLLQSYSPVAALLAPSVERALRALHFNDPMIRNCR